MAHANLLTVEQLNTDFLVSGKTLRAIDALSFTITAGETFCLVGESGCGKSVTSLTLMGLLANAEVSAKSLSFAGDDLLSLSREEYRKLRGSKIAMIFQEPMTALNPVYQVGEQVAEVFSIHEGLSKSEANKRALELFRKVKIPAPEKRFYDYPHQLSGGMKQRVMIAMALACKPKLLIADEPTTALDVTVQAQILHLLQELQKEEGTAILFITHDLGVVAQIADRVGVMYCGRMIEVADVYSLYEHPSHPYTKALLASIPSVDSDRSQPLTTIKGTVPSLDNKPSGCVFRTRCPRAQEKCAAVQPELETVNSSQRVACFFPHSEGEQ